MLDLLLHPPASPEQARIGATVSVAVHALLVLMLAVGPGEAVVETEPGSGSIIETAIKYLLPPDKKGAPPEERAQWVAQRSGDEAQNAMGIGVPAPRPPAGQSPQDAPGKAPVPLIEAAIAQDAFTLVDVDSAAVRDPESTAPTYPRLLEARGIEGIAVVRFVVDSTGMADLASFQLVETNHQLFGAAVRAAIPGMKFRPATIGGRRVRQLVELPFVFNIERRPEPAPVRKP